MGSGKSSQTQRIITSRISTACDEANKPLEKGGNNQIDLNPSSLQNSIEDKKISPLELKNSNLLENKNIGKEDSESETIEDGIKAKLIKNRKIKPSKRLPVLKPHPVKMTNLDISGFIRHKPDFNIIKDLLDIEKREGFNDLHDYLEDEKEDSILKIMEEHYLEDEKEDTILKIMEELSLKSDKGQCELLDSL